MTLRTLSAVRGFTLSGSLMVRDTVAVETLARLATSLMFIWRSRRGGVAIVANVSVPGARRPDRPARPQPRQTQWRRRAVGAIVLHTLNRWERLSATIASSWTTA